MDYGTRTLDEMKKGFYFDRQTNSHTCNYCGEAFEEGQVFSINGNFYVPEHAAAKHVALAHGGAVNQLLDDDSKYSSLTAHQRTLLRFFLQGMPDREIARELGVSDSTIRRQRFSFREKAKQAKLFLAVFELVFGQDAKGEEAMIPIHNRAAYYDDRYLITEREKAHILATFFREGSPLVLKSFSPKEKNKVVILGRIAQEFRPGRIYTEQEINAVLKPIYADYATLRRYLIMYGFMERTKDGSGYWLTR